MTNGTVMDELHLLGTMPAQDIASLDYTDPMTLYVHDLELAASLIEVIASLGWAYTWWLTYPRGPGRGWTLDDPDLWGILMIVIPSWTYLAYNVMVSAAG